jgi:hypothetical protein
VLAHRREPARSDALCRGQFERLRPVPLVAAGYGLATIVWIFASGALPGGRRLA